MSQDDVEAESAARSIRAIPAGLLIPDRLPVLPTRNSVAFPGVLFVLDVGRRNTIAAVQAALADPGRLLAVVQQRDVRDERPDRDGLHDMACVVQLVKFARQDADGGGVAIGYGVARVRLGAARQDRHLMSADVMLPLPPPMAAGGDALAALRAHVRRLVPFFAGVDLPPDLGEVLDAIADPELYADAVAGTLGAELDTSDDVRQRLLDIVDVGERLRVLEELVRRRADELSNAR